MYRVIINLYHKNKWLRFYLTNIIKIFWFFQSRVYDNNINKKDLISLQTFYNDNSTLYLKIDETTGDHHKQCSDIKAFLGEHKQDLYGESIIDLGCGDGKRISLMIAKILENSHVMGIDLVSPNKFPKAKNLQFTKSNIIDMPFVEDNSIKLATANWSVLNDILTRRSQVAFFKELSRVIKPGGFFYCDIPSFEGKYGYSIEANKYKKKHPHILFGSIEKSFDDRKKIFYIYTNEEIETFLNIYGFHILKNTQWLTSSQNLTRRTIIAVKTKNRC